MGSSLRNKKIYDERFKQVKDLLKYFETPAIMQEHCFCLFGGAITLDTVKKATGFVGLSVVLGLFPIVVGGVFN